MATHDRRRGAAKRRGGLRGAAILRFEPLESRQLLSTTTATATVGGPDLAAVATGADAYSDWGGPIHVSGTVQNIGNADAAGDFKVDVYVSSTPTPDASAVKIGTVDVPDGLKAGAQASFSQDFDLPPTAVSGVGADGAIYIGLVADSQGNIAETNEANNYGQRLGHGLGAGADPPAVAGQPGGDGDHARPALGDLGPAGRPDRDDREHPDRHRPGDQGADRPVALRRGAGDQPRRDARRRDRRAEPAAEAVVAGPRDGHAAARPADGLHRRRQLRAPGRAGRRPPGQPDRHRPLDHGPRRRLRGPVDRPGRQRAGPLDHQARPVGLERADARRHAELGRHLPGRRDRDQRRQGGRRRADPAPASCWPARTASSRTPSTSATSTCPTAWPPAPRRPSPRPSSSPAACPSTSSPATASAGSSSRSTR